jgi:hypothetical protein
MLSSEYLMICAETSRSELSAVRLVMHEIDILPGQCTFVRNLEDSYGDRGS